MDPTENVYLVQLSWRGAGRLILEEKDKVSNEHGMLTETYSDPIGGQGWSSPSNIRRHSRYDLFWIMHPTIPSAIFKREKIFTVFSGFNNASFRMRI